MTAVVTGLVTTFKRYLARCTRREQMYLLTAGVLLTLTAGWLLVWQPVFNARAASESRLQYAEQNLAQVNTLAAELAAIRNDMSEASTQATSVQPLPQVLNTLAAQIGLPVSSLEPAADNQSAGVRFDAVSMPLLLAWLAELESTPGIRIEQLTLSPASGTQVAGDAGPVNASLRVRGVTR